MPTLKRRAGVSRIAAALTAAAGGGVIANAASSSSAGAGAGARADVATLQVAARRIRPSRPPLARDGVVAVEIRI